MEPVDPDEAPDYYKVITDPMGNLFLLISIWYVYIAKWV